MIFEDRAIPSPAYPIRRRRRHTRRARYGKTEVIMENMQVSSMLLRYLASTTLVVDVTH
jgi:hypothetical protein